MYNHMLISFRKMHGTGNDFVVIDARQSHIRLDKQKIKLLSSREHPLTKGCDQLIILEKDNQTACFMRIYNADGSEVGACGNATRCIGWLMMQEENAQEITIRTLAGKLHCTVAENPKDIVEWNDADAIITANLGKPGLDWSEIPLSVKEDTLHVSLEIDDLSNPVCVSMGNPHAVFFAETAEKMDMISETGYALQTHPMFPEAVNVSIAHIEPDFISLRVWERGVGLTASCGTAACATVISAIRRSLVERDKIHTVVLNNPPANQTLRVEWARSGHVLLTGPVVQEFSAEVEV